MPVTVCISNVFASRSRENWGTATAKRVMQPGVVGIALPQAPAVTFRLSQAREIGLLGKDRQPNPLGIGIRIEGIFS